MDMGRKLNEKDLEDSDEDDSSSSSSEDEKGPQVLPVSVLRPQGQRSQKVDGADSLDSSDDSEDGEEDVEMEVDEDALQLELTTVVDKLLLEPYSYDLYLDKIRILKALGDLSALRTTREKMSQLYPLSPTLWLDWIKDEQKLISNEEEKERVINLMDRAVKDYSSVEVWLEYINFCLSHVEEENGEQRGRDVFERALASCGLNVSMGSLIWDTYRDFEAALLATKTTEDEQVEQEKRYINLCRRQLSVPLLNMKLGYKHIKSKIELDANTEAAYKKAVQRLNDLESWEAKLVQAPDDYNKIQAYKNYIEDEKKSKSNPARIQCLYERALTEIPLDLNLWMEYIDYLSTNLKIPEVILTVAERASRNCPWIITIWTKYMWVVETFCEGEEVFETMRTVFEKAIVYCATVEQAGTLWLKYLEFLRRAVNYDTPNPKPLEILRKTFAAAEQHLLQIVEEPNDYVSQILQFKARFEANLIKSMTAEVREIWKDIFYRGYVQNFRVWVQYISQQIKYGADLKKIRSELSRGMTYVRDDPNSMADMWLNFERDHGDLTSLITCETKISKELEKVVAVTAVTADSSGLYYQKEAPFKGQKENRAQARKRKFEDSVNPGSAKKGRPESTKMDVVDGRSSESGFKMPSIPKRRLDDDNETKGAEKKSEIPAPVKHDPSKDHRAVFVSNLDFNTNEEGLRQFFSECGTIEDVRLVRDFKGRSKGFGYVFFDSGDSVKPALEKDRDPLDNRPVFVSKCDPDKSNRQVQFKYPTALEKSKIFIKGLPFSTTVEELQEMFGKFGSVKDCRLVTHRNGHSKGLAYVEFEKEASASAAILKTDGMKIQEHVISVSISNPPTKNSKTVPSMKFAPSRSEPDQRRSRNMFVPRALQVHPSAGSGGSGSSSSKQEDAITPVADVGAKTTASKSNDDFRKLFMKQ